MKKQTSLALLIAGATALTLACSQSSAPPTSPAGIDGGGSSANADGSTLKVTSPTLASPVGGIEVTDSSPILTINNSTGRFVQNLALSYVFEVLNANGQVVYRSNPVAAGSGGQTSHHMPQDLEFNANFTWRAWAVYQNQRGPAATTGAFRVFSRFGQTCTAPIGQEFVIVQCRIDQYEELEEDILPELMERIAWDLNQGGHEWAPYGRLVKTTGNNCHGYSCDIICSDAGGFQRQWDVLIDEAVGAWQRVDGEGVVTRPCEVPRQ